MKRVTSAKVMFLPRAASSKDGSVRTSKGLAPRLPAKTALKDRQSSPQDGWASVVTAP